MNIIHELLSAQVCMQKVETSTQETIQVPEKEHSFVVWDHFFKWGVSVRGPI